MTKAARKVVKVIHILGLCITSKIFHKWLESSKNSGLYIYTGIYIYVCTKHCITNRVSKTSCHWYLGAYLINHYFKTGMIFIQ